MPEPEHDPERGPRRARSWGLGLFAAHAIAVAALLGLAFRVFLGR